MQRTVKLVMCRIYLFAEMSYYHILIFSTLLSPCFVLGTVWTLTNEEFSLSTNISATASSPVIQFRRDQNNAPGVKCDQSGFISRESSPLTFTLRDHVYQTSGRRCSWKISGVDGCKSVINCNTTKIESSSCDQEYVEVTDGYEGYLKVCQDYKELQPVVNISGGGALRDIYVHYKAVSNYAKKQHPVGNVLLSCTVNCLDGSGQFTPLLKKRPVKKNRSCNCGVPPNQNRVVGGDPVGRNEFPWMASLVETNTRQTYCGASIINNRYILTARHCLRGRFSIHSNFQVLLHANFLDELRPNASATSKWSWLVKTYSPEELAFLDRTNGSLRYNVSQLIIYPVHLNSKDSDVALVKLDRELDLTPPTGLAALYQAQTARTICLPKAGSYEDLFSGQMAVVVGWGLRNSTLKITEQRALKATVKVFPHEECVSMYKEADKEITQRMLCAGFKEGGIDACQVDSGGPLLFQENKIKPWQQIGITSFGVGCAKANRPGVYVRVTEISQWINYQSNYNLNWSSDTDDDSQATWCRTP